MPEMRYFTKEEQKKYTEAINKIYKPVESEKEKLLSKHILELQADKGRLTDRVRELEAQIEKMKCCENCQTVRDAEGNCYLLKDGKCKNKDKWELRR